MLERITIKNLALISDAELEFSENLTVLSGETGAGKSIIVDAFMLLMGGKYDKTMLSYGTDSGFVEGVFSFPGGAPEALGEYGGDDQYIIRRKFGADGKNDIRINGSAVTAGMLKGIVSQFADICGQNEYQVLSKKSEHAAILDGFAAEKLFPVLVKISEKYKQLLEVKKQLASLGDAAARERRIDALTYQINEIESAKIYETEEEELAILLHKITHGEKIKTALSDASGFIGGENGCIDGIAKAAKLLMAVSSFSQGYSDLSDRLSSVEIELGDISDALISELNEVDFDPDALEETENRLALIKNIKRKYGEISALGKFLASLKSELDLLSGSDDIFEKLTGKKLDLSDALYNLSIEASEIRKAAAEKLETEVVRELSSLGMEKARFSVKFAELPAKEDCDEYITAKGLDDIEFYLSPNLGQPLLPLIKIISGGEMSRFMLALKVIASKFGTIGTMIFDEIDTGISGRVGQEVAKKLAVISRNCQVLCVTHLPQIASMADTHYFISKNDNGVTTKTYTEKLSGGGMIDEITRLSGSGGITSNAKANAAELKAWSDEYKNSL